MFINSLEDKRCAKAIILMNLVVVIRCTHSNCLKTALVSMHIKVYLGILLLF